MLAGAVKMPPAADAAPNSSHPSKLNLSPPMKTTSLLSQKKLALALLDWHGGQSSPLYAVGSCMLSDSDKGRLYDPANHRGHADTEDESGCLSMAILELRKMKERANFPEAVKASDEKACNRLAEKLAKFKAVPA
jgi:hypothetical protein